MTTTYAVGDDRFDDFATALEAAESRRARLVKRWAGPLGPCQSDEPAAYPVVEETAERLWVESPIGVIGIPAIRSSASSDVAATHVELRVCEFASGTGVQVSSVRYADGRNSEYSGTCFGADQIARCRP